MTRRNRLLAVGFVFVFLSLACNLPSQRDDSASPVQNLSTGTPFLDGGTPPPASGPETLILLTEDGEEVEVEAPPPSAIHLLYDRVDQGEITLQDGALDGLRLLTGAEPETDLFDEVDSLDGYIFSTLAVEAYQEADEATRQEIERLYRILAPTRDVLDAYSEPFDPETGFALGSRKLAALVPQSFVDCRELWQAGFPSDGATRCLYRVISHAGGQEHRVYFPMEWRDRPGFSDYLQAVTQALEDSIRVYQPFQSPRQIDVIFSLLDSTQGRMFALVPVLTPGEIRDMPCPVVIMPNFDGRDVEMFKQTLAHEIFHCVEYWHQGPTSGAGPIWYIEGMAEFFSGVVYPNVNSEHRYLESFSVRSVAESLVSMKYESWVFFQYLSNQQGHAYVFDLLDLLPRSGSETAQARALSNIPGMEATFHKFGQAFLDRNLHDENGALLPARPFIDPDYRYDVDDTTHISIDADAFHLSRYLFTFRKSRDYDIAVETSEGAGIVTARPVSSGGWVTPPLHFATPCKTSRSYLVLVTASDRQSQYVGDFNVQAETRECDPCLVGVWEADVSQVAPYLETQINAGGVHLNSVEGHITLRIGEDGTYEYTTGDYVLSVSSVSDITQFTSEISISLYSIGTVFKKEEGILTSVETDFNILGTAVTTFSDGTAVTTSFEVDPEDMDVRLGLPSGSWPYNCTSTTLTVPGPGDTSMVFTKVSGGD